jgi:hypothetical protein
MIRFKLDFEPALVICSRVHMLFGNLLDPQDAARPAQSVRADVLGR